MKLFENYFQNRHQRVRQGSVLGPFSVYINDLTDNISTQMRLFADDSSRIARVEWVEPTHEKLVKDLGLTMENVFNPDLTKQATEVIFSVKKKKLEHPELLFSGTPVSREDHTKHLGVCVDRGLSVSKHIREAVMKATKGVSLLKYLSKYVSRNVLDLSYKLYLRHHLQYGDEIYHNQRTDL